MSDLSNNLQKLLSCEVYARLTYMKVGAFMESQNFKKAATDFKNESQEEAVHVARVLDRMYELNINSSMSCPQDFVIDPNLTSDSFIDMLKKLLEMENSVITLCHAVIESSDSDSVTKALIEEILSDEEKHKRDLENEIKMHKIIGEQNYMNRWI